MMEEKLIDERLIDLGNGQTIPEKVWNEWINNMSKGKLMDNNMEQSNLGGVRVTVGVKGRVVVIKTAKPVTKLELDVVQVSELTSFITDLAFPPSKTFIWGGEDETENL